ncbi:MAG: ComF family protein [Desulfuromonadales bacterium]|nr:ComF family protein [Desulfuromonadales bacterium]
MWTRFRLALTASIDLLLPPACLLCGGLLPTGHDAQTFCRDCLATMRPLTSAHCRCCAQPFPDTTSNHLCGICLQRPPPFSIVHAAGIYQGKLKEAIHKLKYRNRLALAKPLGQLLGKSIVAAGNGFAPDRIIPVPLHPRRLRQRGYNQALEVARPIAQQSGLLLDTTLLQRTRNTPQQQGLSATERRSNLRNAFTLTSRAPALRILLIDDVMTTGETVRECSRTLLAGGIDEVQVAVVGRA